MAHRTVQRDIPLLLTSASTGVIDPNSPPLRTSWTYSTWDPFAVRITFYGPEDGEANTWLFGRDLLRIGLRVGAGEGDVKIQPHPQLPLIEITLSSDDGRAMLHADRVAVQNFIDLTDQLIPPGEEVIDLDAGVAELLRGRAV